MKPVYHSFSVPENSGSFALVSGSTPLGIGRSKTSRAPSGFVFVHVVVSAGASAPTCGVDECCDEYIDVGEGVVAVLVEAGVEMAVGILGGGARPVAN